MAIQKKVTKVFGSGTHNILDNEVIPEDAASDSLGWYTRDGELRLMQGRQIVGAEGASGKIYNEHTAYTVNGTKVRYRKTATKVQYFDGTTWQDVITGLTDAYCTFANYQSTAGAFLFIFNRDGIYKIVTANPASYSSMYDASKNFKGYAFIDIGRTILWGREKDGTGIYGSHSDQLNITAVSAEAIGSSGSTNYTGTLAFKAGGATRTCTGVSFTDTVETFTDNFDGTLTGDAGGAGTINYTTGAYNITFNATTGSPVTSDYSWEDSNDTGLTDFTFDTPRTAIQGFYFGLDDGGDPVQQVLNLEGTYFAIKQNSVYSFVEDADGEFAPELFRRDVGATTRNAAVGASAGIIMLDTSNKVRARILQIKKNPFGDSFLPEEMFTQFKFENYTFDEAYLDVWDKYLLIACKEDSTTNNRIILCDMSAGTVDVVAYEAQCFTKQDNVLYAGSSISETSYEMFTGFDDIGFPLTNYWVSSGQTFEYEGLKKTKKLRFKGRISHDQAVAVYIQLDNGVDQLVGTIIGDADYVDSGASGSIGTTMVGEDVVGVGSTDVSTYFVEIKIRTGKFRKRNIKFVAENIGFFSVSQITDFDIWTYQDKIPEKYRLKQNVSRDGQTTGLSEPDF